MSEGEIYFEFIQVGQLMRVAAVDAATGTEVIVVTPVSASRQHMQQLALGKLRRRLGEGADGADPTPPAISGKFA